MLRVAPKLIIDKWIKILTKIMKKVLKRG